jgi:NADPH:quinone reductase-like Zn-dependent oxidoreductase
VPIGGLVAFQALFSFPLLFEPTLEGWGNVAGLDGRNSKVHLLITGAASPAGVWAIQLAKLAGVHKIVATCSAEDIPFVRSLGANVALDWAEDGNLRGWSAESGGQFNAVLDLMGGHTLTRAWRLVRDGGKIVSVARDTASARPAGASNNVLHYNFVLANCPKHLKTIAYLADTGHLKPVLDPEDIFEFDDFEAALQKLRNHRRGQVVLQLRPLVLGGIIDLLRTNGRKWENQRDFDEVVVELSRGEDASDEYD